MSGIEETVAKLRLHLRDHADHEAMSVDGYTKEFVTLGDLRTILAAVDTLTRERDEAREMMVRFAAIDFSAKHGEPWVASAELQGKAVEVFTAALVDLFRSQGGPNYVEAKLRDPRTLAEYFAYIGPITGKTAHELRRDAEARADRYRAALGKYGQHEEMCNKTASARNLWAVPRMIDETPCTCGLDAARGRDG